MNAGISGRNSFLNFRNDGLISVMLTYVKIMICRISYRRSGNPDRFIKLKFRNGDQKIERYYGK